MNREEDLSNGFVLTNLASKLGAGLYQEPVCPQVLNVGCCKCNVKNHALVQCKEFLALTPEQRLAFANDKAICFTCLDPSKHEWRACSKKRTCGTQGCNRRHHPLLHQTSTNNNLTLNTAAVPFVPQPHVHSSHLGTNVAIKFKVVPIRIHGSDKKFVDDGSSLSMLEEDLFNELGLEGKPEQLTLQWTKGVSRHEDSMRTSLTVSSVNRRKQYVLKDVYTVKDLGLASQSIDVAQLKILYPHLRGLPLKDQIDAKPKILLGLDQAKFLLGHGQRHGKEDEPYALKTVLGWIVYLKSASSGHVSCTHQTSKPSMKLMFHDAIKTKEDLHDLVKRHFTTEEFGVMPPKGELVSREVRRSVDIMERTLKLVGGRYQIGLLWDSDDVRLPDSFPMALNRLIALEKSLRKRPHLLEWYNNYMRDLISKGYAGIVSLFIIRGRIVLQDVRREGFDWDEPVSSELRISWLAFLQELKHIENLRIPRRYVSWNPDDSKVSLIIFVDASEKAFAAVAYLRFERDDKVEVAQVMAKAKVAPVKQLSVPRLELQAAVLGVRLASTIKASHTIRIDELLFLSDSRTVLSWINSTKYKFPAFVASRVGEILESTSPRQWFHIGSNDNVADDGTKWIETSMGNYETRWFKGPEFLKQPIGDWPVNQGKVVVDLTNDELLGTKLMLHVKQPKSSYGVYDMLSARFRAKWSSSVRVIAFLLRFRDILRKKPTEKEVFITPFEFCQAENWLFRKIQMDVFSTDITSLKASGKVHSSSSILSLSPFLDEDGTHRMSSRAQKANTSYASRNPAILPRSHPLVDLLIQHHHEKNFHLGTDTVISDIRERAWIISIRGALEKVRFKCNLCRRLKAKPVMPLMGQLPEARLAFDSRPFTHVGVDCFGPLLVKFSRGTVKRYGMIFTCLTFRAVQIELLNDLSLDQCTMAVRRFVINRVVTRFLYSDNGLNFVGAKSLLDKDAKEMEASLSEYSAKYQGILWRFIPAYSPWMGGAWERLIQSIKKTVDFVLKNLIPREDVLRNALMEAQGQINRRPLTHIPVDPEDPKPLTPNSMIFGQDDRDVTAPRLFSESDACSRLYSRRAQHLMTELTRRWYTEYLPVITRRSKWFKNTKQVELDDIVVVIEPNEIRSAWRLGRVVKIYPGPDGVVRMADVKLPNGVIKAKRSVGRLAVLDLKSSP